MFRGGPHGEVQSQKFTSHDGEKKTNEEDFPSEAQASEEVVDNEGQGIRSNEAQRSSKPEDRQIQQSYKQVAESNPKEEVATMIDETSSTPKAKAAQAVGAMFNDARVTNVLMLVLVLIGMGGADALQHQVCSL